MLKGLIIGLISTAAIRIRVDQVTSSSVGWLRNVGLERSERIVSLLDVLHEGFVCNRFECSSTLMLRFKEKKTPSNSARSFEVEERNSLYDKGQYAFKGLTLILSVERN